MWRVRPWVLGIALVACGFVTDIGFRLWVADFAGRIEMGGFATLEALLFASGLVLCLPSLVQPPEKSGDFRGIGCLFWVVVFLASAWIVLTRLPP